VTQRLALACARNPWLTVGAWIGAIVVALLLVGTLLGGNLTGEGKVTNNPESLRAYDLQADRFPGQESFDELVVVRAAALKVDDRSFRAKVGEVAAALEETGGVAKAVSYSGGQPGLVSSDRHATLVAVMLREPGEDHIEDVITAVERFDGQAGFETSITGEFTFDHDSARCPSATCRMGSSALVCLRR
jgi:MMPL family protein